MNNSHRLITALVATCALLIGSAIGSSAVAQEEEDQGEGLVAPESPQDQINNTYPKRHDAMRRKSVPAAVPRTGQTTCYEQNGGLTDCRGTGQDGDKLAGAVAPTPRFVDNRNGTVTDKLTGLIWLKNANCLAISPADWLAALTNANNLANGQCGLTDGSRAGQWRLPNVKELQSLISYGFVDPALSNSAGNGQWTENDAFSGVQMRTYYWSSSSYVSSPDFAWFIYLLDGYANFGNKTVGHYVWPVRGGQ